MDSRTTPNIFFSATATNDGINYGAATITSAKTKKNGYVSSAPIDLTATPSATPSGATVQVSWSPPLDTGGMPLEYFVLRCNGAKVSSGSKATSFVDILKPGATILSYTVQAQNSIGSGAPCAAVNISVVAGAPFVSAPSNGATWALLTWSKPVQPSGATHSSCTGFTIYDNSTGSMGGNFVASLAGNVRNATVLAYAPNRIIQYQVYAIWTPSLTVPAGPGVAYVLTAADDSATVHGASNGSVSSGFYPNNADLKHVLRPYGQSWTGITLTFSVFDVECENDFVRVYDARSGPAAAVFSGGCKRDPFSVTLATSNPVVVELISDGSVTGAGITFMYSATTNAGVLSSAGGPASCPVVAASGGSCSGTAAGNCSLFGVCVCGVGRSGEACQIVAMPRCGSMIPCGDNASAIIFVGPTGSDDGAGTLAGNKPLLSLKHALDVALSGGMRRRFLTPVARTVTLLPGTYSVCGVVVAGDVRIVGVGPPGTVVLSCVGAAGLSVSSASPVFIGVTFSGNVTGDGGGVTIHGTSAPQFLNVSFTQCAAPGGRGGGMLLTGAGVRVYVRGSTFINNTAQLGGAVHVADGATLTLNDVEASDNVALHGGAVYATNASVVMCEAGAGTVGLCAVMRRNSAISGGTAYLNGSASVSGLDMSGGTATTGAGLFVGPNATVSVFSLRISGCSASTSGGGIGLGVGSVLAVTAGPGVVTVAHCTAATGSGGGLYAAAGATFAPSARTSFSSCSAYSGGGAFLEHGANALQVHPLVVQDSWATYGGAAAIGGSFASLNVVAQSCVAVVGGGAVAVINASGVRLAGSATNCSSLADAGGAYLNNSDVSVPSGLAFLVQRCYAARGGGGIAAVGIAAVRSVTIAHCHANISGGGIEVLAGSRVYLTDVVVSSSTASGGGGISVQNGSFAYSSGTRIESCVGAVGAGITLNISASFWGGGNTTVENCRATDATFGGGGVHCFGCSSVSGLIVRNCSGHTGGGMSLRGASNVSLSDLLVTGCTALYAGGGLRVDSSTVASSGSVMVTGCHADHGGGMMMTGKVALVGACTLIANSAASVGGNVASSGSDSKLLRGTVIAAGRAPHGGNIGLSALSFLTLETCTVSAGTACMGAGVYSNSGGVLRSEVRFAMATRVHNNVAIDCSGPGLGGAGFANNTLIVVSGNSSVASNRAACGGAFALDGDTLLRGDYVAGANASAAVPHVASNSASIGGGVCALSGRVTVANIVISACTASIAGGGAAAMSGSTLTAVHLVITGCSSNSVGGGVAVGGSSTLNITWTTVERCTAVYGAGVFASSVTSSVAGLAPFGAPGRAGGIALLDHATIRNCGASTGSGGGLFIDGSKGDGSADVTASDLLLEGNSAQRGGGCFLSGKLVMSRSTAISNHATGPTDGGLAGIGRGGHLFVSADGAARIVDVVFTGMSAGVTCPPGASLGSCTYHGGPNPAADITDASLGAAIAVFGGILTLNSSLLQRHVAQDGGVVAVDSSGSATLGSCILADNFGVGLRVTGSASAVAERTVFLHNGARAGGGAAVCTGDLSYLALSACTFEGNSGTAGGALQVSAGASMVVAGGVLRNNAAVSTGGAIEVDIDGSLVARNCEMVGNSAGLQVSRRGSG